MLTTFQESGCGRQPKNLHTNKRKALVPKNESIT